MDATLYILIICSPNNIVVTSNQYVLYVAARQPF